MKLEVKTGIHSNKKTKKCKFPLPENTRIYLDGKEMKMFDYFYLEIEVDQPVKYLFGHRRRNYPLRKIVWFFKRLMRNLR